MEEHLSLVEAENREPTRLGSKSGGFVHLNTHAVPIVLNNALDMGRMLDSDLERLESRGAPCEWRVGWLVWCAGKIGSIGPFSSIVNAKQPRCSVIPGCGIEIMRGRVFVRGGHQQFEVPHGRK